MKVEKSDYPVRKYMQFCPKTFKKLEELWGSSSLLETQQYQLGIFWMTFQQPASIYPLWNHTIQQSESLSVPVHQQRTSPAYDEIQNYKCVSRITVFNEHHSVFCCCFFWGSGETSKKKMLDFTNLILEISQLQVRFTAASANTMGSWSHFRETSTGIC